MTDIEAFAVGAYIGVMCVVCILHGKQAVLDIMWFCLQCISAVVCIWAKAAAIVRRIVRR